MRTVQTDLKAYGIIFAVSYLTAVFIFKDFLFSSGVVNTGDLVWPYFRSQSHQYTSTLHQFPNHIPYFELLWSIPASTAVLERVLYLSVFTLIGTVSGIVIYRFLAVYVAIDETTAVRIGVMGGLVYLLNPLNVFYASQIFLPLGYALYPLVIYLCYSALSPRYRGTTSRGVALGIVVAAMSGDPRWPVWSFVSAGLLVTALSVTMEDSRKQLFKSIQFVGVAVVCSLALSSFWVVPLLQPQEYVSQNVVWKQSIDMWNAYSTWVNAFRFHADWWPPLRRAFRPAKTPFRGVWYLSGLVLPIVALGSVLLGRRRTTALAVPYVALIFIATAPTSSIEAVQGLYDWAVFTLPFGSAFRTAFKWLLPASFPLVLMASVAIGTLLDSESRPSRVLGTTLALLLVASAVTNSWMLFVGDMGGEREGFVPNHLPEDEAETYRTLRQNVGEHAVLALPQAPSHGLPMRTIGTDSFVERLPDITDRHGESVRNALLRQISVTYLVEYPDDGGVETSQIRDARRIAYVPDLVLSGDLSDSNAVAEVNGLNDTSIVTGSREVGSEYQIVSESENETFENGTVIHPSSYTTNRKPEYGWVGITEAYTPTRWVRNALDEREPEGLFSGRTFVVASTNRSLPKSVQKIDPKDEALLDHWTFQSNGNGTEFFTPNTESIAVAVANGRLTTTINDSTPGWKVVRSPAISVERGDHYRFGMSMWGVASHDVHLKVSEFDADGTRLRTDRVSGAGDGTFQERVQFSYEPRNKSVSHVKFEIWQGDDSPDAPTNRLWVDDVRVYNVSQYLEPMSMDIPFHVDESGSYKLLARYLENRKGGTVRLSVDGEPVTIDTEDRLNRVVENEVGTFELEAGRHTVSLRNVNGVNAIAALSVLREDEFEESWRAQRRAMANKTVFHVLEAETELYLDDPVARTEGDASRNVTDGDLVALQNESVAHNTVEIRANGSYRPAIRGVGNFTVIVDNRTYDVESDELRLTHLEPITLAAGKHDVRVVAEGRSRLDAIWVYTAGRNETIAETLSSAETNASVESLTKVSPTKYRVEVDSDEPYVLSFAEEYSPLWTAEVRTSEGVDQYDPVALYSAINGFRIDETGEHTVVVRYQPQQWFYTGSVVSLLALVGCLGFLVVDLRRRLLDGSGASNPDPQRTTVNRSTPSSAGSLTHGRPLSTYVVLLAIVLLGGSGVVLLVPTGSLANYLGTFAYYSVVISSEATANTLARLAYYTLVVGLALQVGGYLAPGLGERVRTVLSSTLTAIRTWARENRYR